MNKIINFFLSLIYPSECICCMDNVMYDIDICEECLKNISFNDINKIEYKFKYLKNAFSPFKYKSNVRKGIHHFKFRNKPQTGKYWSRYMYAYIKDALPKMNIDYISFVPMHKSKLKIRKYNQSKILAENIARLSKIPLKKTLIKSKNHLQLHEVEIEKRYDIIKNSFECKIELGNKNILLIDDVLTTGSTLDECAKALKNSGANNVFACTIACVK